MIHKLITTRSKFGNYFTEERAFADERHFDNWFNKVISSGLNVTGVQELKEMLVTSRHLAHTELRQYACIELNCVFTDEETAILRQDNMTKLIVIVDMHVSYEFLHIGTSVTYSKIENVNITKCKWQNFNKIEEQTLTN